jgi:hypothetical protein
MTPVPGTLDDAQTRASDHRVMDGVDGRPRLALLIARFPADPP